MKKVVVLLSIFLVATGLTIGKPVKKAETKTWEPGKEHKSEKTVLRKFEGKDVSIQAINSFAEDFANASDIHWRRSENFDEASFTKNDGKKFIAFYDDDGQLIGTTQHVTFADVPLKGQQKIKKVYYDYKTGEVIFFDDNMANESDMVFWSSPVDNEDNYFVELIKPEKKIIVRVATNGDLSFFKEIK